jgi:hypothetical protein
MVSPLPFTGGADGGIFSIDRIKWRAQLHNAPGFRDAGRMPARTHVYDLTVTVTDTFGDSDQQAISVTVTDLSEAGLIVNGGEPKRHATGRHTGNDTMQRRRRQRQYASRVTW